MQTRQRPASPGRRGWGAALLVTAAVALVGARLAAPSGGLRPVGRDRPVNVGAGDPGDITANNSPTVVADPRDHRRLAVTSRIDSPDYSCALYASSDGGARWTRTRVPIAAGEPPKCYAPDAAFGPDGTLYVSYVTLQGAGNEPHAVWVASSRDGGRTLGRPHRVAGPLAFQVRLAADPGRAGRLYVTWVQARDVGLLKFAAPGNPILAARSQDGGRSWRRPVRVSAPARERVLAPTPAVDGDGRLYVLFVDVGDDRLDYEGGHEGAGGPPYPGPFALVLARSRDRGTTWEASVVDDAIVPTRRFVSFLPPYPSLAFDRSRGRVYAAFEDARAGSPDVSLWSLPRGGVRWNGPVRVNDTPRDDRTSQYLPQLAVAPDGRLDVVYYDRRADAVRNRDNEVSLQSSADGGASFGAHLTLSSRSFDSRVGPGGERGLADLGSRLGLVAGARRTVAAWTDTREGTEASAKQDIVHATVAADPSHGSRALAAGLGIAAFVLLACGLMLVAWLRSGERRTRR